MASAKSKPIWEVVGGASSGGIKVRTGKDTSSEEIAERLTTGAIVKELELDGERLRYEKVSGSGPASGWVSISFKGKALLTKSSREIDEEESTTTEAGFTSDSEEQDSLHDHESKEKEMMNSLEEIDEETDIDNDVLKRYGQRFGLAAEKALPCHGQKAALKSKAAVDFNKKSLPWQQGGNKPSATEVRAELERNLGLDDTVCMDADCEDFASTGVTTCRQCGLPVGEFAYAGDDEEGVFLHAECKAHLMLEKLKKMEEGRKKEDATVKQARRVDYDIGWHPDCVPRNEGPLKVLAGYEASSPLCCLMLGENGRSVRVAPTLEPAAATNLEYLSLALKVRREEGREPLFSLDPVEDMTPDTDPGDFMQVKRFEPAWLAGTSVGEVLFQADYHLKELSMGEYEQPVIGMKSCWEYSKEQGIDNEWRAREWFVVKKAEIRLSEDNVLIPDIKMGVEAREQVMGPRGLKDAPITRPDHPMVKYAEVFTQNFDLIAERKSVIFNLRELGKASVLAKYLIEAGTALDDAFWHLAGAAKPACCLELPQLWNERASSTLHIHDGQIVEAAKGASCVMHGVYGGVDFGLDKFQLHSRMRPSAAIGAVRAGAAFGRVRPAAALSASMRPSAAIGSMLSGVSRGAMRPAAAMGTMVSGVSMGRMRPAAAIGAMQAGVSLGPMHRQRAMTQLSGMARSVSPVARAPHSMVTRLSGMARSVSPMARGVDLNLNDFNLAEHTRVEDEAAVGSWSEAAKVAEAGREISKEFWVSLGDDNKSVFKGEDKTLLKQVYNPLLSDRREDGDMFVPPQTSFSYVQKLRHLVQEEASVQRQRKAHFFSSKFDVNEPGSLFPSSWAQSFELAHGLGVEKVEASTQAALLHSRPEYKAQGELLERAIRSAMPVFDNSTEDGNRYRIYRFGSLEVRTTQEHGDKEVVGAVFSKLAPARASSGSSAEGANAMLNERIVKVTGYVETTDNCSVAPGLEQKVQPSHCQIFLVMDTDAGNVVVTEKLKDGTATWEENPSALELRISLAKVVCCTDCSNEKVKVKDILASRNQESRCVKGKCSFLKRKKYAQAVCNQARGIVQRTTADSKRALGAMWWHELVAGKGVRRAVGPNPKAIEVKLSRTPLRFSACGTNKGRVHELRSKLIVRGRA